jgi:uncharacterized cupin superfamily protein
MASPIAKNIFESAWETKKTPRGGIWTHLDISGEHLGLRVEELAPGDTSSIHHFHTLEEEHVIALEGEASLMWGTEEHPIRRGDHVWFKAGETVGHHIVNRSERPFRFLVIGERNAGDVVFYPERGVAMVKALGWKQYDFKPRN